MKGIWAVPVIVSILILGVFATAIPTASATHPVTSIPLPVTGVRDIGIDPSLNKIFVATTTGRLVIVDGSTDTVSNILGLASVQIHDGEMAVNPVTHRVYITDAFPSSLIVVDGVTETSLPTIFGIGPGCNIGVTVNSATNTIFGSSQCFDHIIKIDGVTGAIISFERLFGVGSLNEANPTNGLVYNRVGSITKVYDGATNPPSLVTSIPSIVLTVNPITNLVYSTGFSSVKVFDGNIPSHPEIADIPFGSVTGIGAVNHNTDRLYVPLTALGEVAVVDTTTNLEIDRITVAASPSRAVVNPDNGKVYVLHTGNTVSVFDDSATPPDTDGDGFDETVDCDDNNAAIFPGAPEVFNGVDDNCDGNIDEGITPQEGAETVIDDIQDLVDSGAINGGQGNALSSKLDNIIKKLDKGQTNAACNQLGAFVNQVESFIDDGTLTAAEGQPLLDKANLLIANVC